MKIYHGNKQAVILLKNDFHGWVLSSQIYTHRIHFTLMPSTLFEKLKTPSVESRQH